VFDFQMSEEESEALRQWAFAAFGSGEHPGSSGE
jgi:hypothetical protein